MSFHGVGDLVPILVPAFESSLAETRDDPLSRHS
jgi:hypothetical protein